ncbi:hypothetical protein LCGC14_1780770 [marine sediment metagenome]|uniref:Uncharacterized protein n=1 Tax=marine sediment metagenome TaxID=412755 RepID=A0A0F9GVG5_9ZZZZ
MAGATPTEYDDHAQTDEEFGANKINNERANLRTTSSVTGSDGIEQHRERFENCGECVFFTKPDICKIVEGPVDDGQVCDWIQGRTGDEDEDAKKIYEAKDFRSFAWGMMRRQPYAHKVIDVEMTPAGWLLLIEDTADPPHRFSLSQKFHTEHTALEHHWTQEEVDSITRTGKAMTFKPPVNFEEASALFVSGELGLAEFEPFKRAHEAEQMAPNPDK